MSIKVARGLWSLIKPKQVTASGPAKRVHLSREEKILSVIDATLRRKSADKSGPKFQLARKMQKGVEVIDTDAIWRHPHMLGCFIDSGSTKVSLASAYEKDLQDAMKRGNLPGEVSILQDPLRVEVLHPNPPIIRLSDAMRPGGPTYWQAICAQSRDELKFNGVLLYDSRDAHLLSFCISKHKHPHATFTGATGAGKTVLLYNALLSIAMRNSPEILSIVLCDKKGKTLPRLNGLPHLGSRIAIRVEDIESAIRGVYLELQRRMTAGDQDIDRQHVLLVIDEFNDTVAAAPDIVDMLIGIAATGRDWGVNLWIAGQKLAGSRAFTPEFYVNLTLRFVGRAANQAEARVNTGEDNSHAHKLPASRGLFYLVTGESSVPGTGVTLPAIVRSLFVGEDEIDGYLRQIQERWRGTRAHFTMGGYNQPERPRVPLTHPDPLVSGRVGYEFLELLKLRKWERDLDPRLVMQTCREWYGQNVLNWTQARTLIEYADE